MEEVGEQSGRQDLTREVAHLMRALKKSSNPEQQMLKWWGKYLQAIITVSTLGAFITFTVLVSGSIDSSSLENTSDYFITKKTARTLLSWSWTCFLATLVYASSVALYVPSPLAQRFSAGPSSMIHFTWVYRILNFCITAAFCLMSTVVTAFEPGAGGFGLGISLVVLVFSVVILPFGSSPGNPEEEL